MLCLLYGYVISYLHRLAKVLLNLKYPQYWDEKKAKYLMISTWLFGLVLCLAAIAATTIAEFDCARACYKYIYPAFDILFIIVAATTYILIFKNFNESKSRVSAVSGVEKNTRRKWIS